MPIVAPSTFIEVCRRFHQEIGEDHPTLEALAAYVVSGLEPADKVALGEFIEELLGGGYTAGELKALFGRYATDVYLTDSKHAVILLEAIRDQVRTA